MIISLDNNITMIDDTMLKMPFKQENSESTGSANAKM